MKTKSFIAQTKILLNGLPATTGDTARLAMRLSEAINRLESVTSQAAAQFKVKDKYATFNKNFIRNLDVEVSIPSFPSAQSPSIEPEQQPIFDNLAGRNGLISFLRNNITQNPARKIEAIKNFRTITHCSLSYAYQAISNWNDFLDKCFENNCLPAAFNGSTAQR